MPTLKRERERVLVCRVLVGVVLALFKGRPHREPHKIVAGDMELLLVDAVVLLATAEKKPKTASGVARAIMLPRPTVLRKLAILIAARVVERKGNYYCKIDRPDIDWAYLDDALTIIRREGRK
jgi:response regulator of citrate/malate metabolism